MNTKHNLEKEPGILWGLLSQEVKSETQRWKICLLATFAFGLIAHGYGFLNFTINHDSLYEFYLSVTTPWKIPLGRFMEPILRYFMGEIMTLPWLTGLMGLLFVGLAVHLISKMFSLDTMWENLLLCGICVTNVTVTGVVASYIHDFCGDMLALLLAVYAAWAWNQMSGGLSLKCIILGAVSLGAVFGFYQAYLSVTISLMCIKSVTELLSGKTAADVIKKLLRAIPMGLLAAAGYFTGVSILLHKVGGTLDGGDNLLDIWKNPSRFWQTVVREYKLVLQDLFLPNKNESIHAVFDPIAAVICWINEILLVLTGISLLAVFRKNAIKAGEILLILLLLFLLPVCMLCVSILTRADHNLTRYAVCLFYLLVLMVSKYGFSGLKKTYQKWQMPLLVCMVGIIIFSNIQMSNVAYIRKDLERQSTMSTMTRALARLEQYEDYEYGKSKVAFIGDVGGEDPSVKSGKVDVIVGMSYKSQITYIPAMKQYFDIVLQYPIDLCDYDESMKLMETEKFQEMGIFPEKDSIATIDGVVVVKLS